MDSASQNSVQLNIPVIPDIEIEEELRNYLFSKLGLVEKDIVSIQKLTGGVSNKTILLVLTNGNRWILKQALKKLRVKDDWFSSPDRIKNEGRGINILNQILPEAKVPKLVFEDYSNYLIAMEAVPEPHKNLKDLFLSGEVNLTYIKQFGDLLACLHNEGSKHNLHELFGDTSFFKSLRLEPYYKFTAVRFPELKEYFNQLIDDCLANSYTLTHGDYSPKNILVFDGQIVLLDHEVIHFGDGTFDLGFSLTHLLSKANHLKNHHVDFINAAHEYWSCYLAKINLWDEDKEKRTIQHTLGCLLARVHGRSPLEYLGEKEKDLQTKICLELMQDCPNSVNELISSFLKKLING